MMYQVTLSEEQLRTIMAALDLYARIGCGQFGELLQLFKFDSRVLPSFDYDRVDWAERMLATIKREMLPLSGASAYSVYSPEVPFVYRLAYDMYQVCRHQLATERKLHSLDVGLDEPHPTTDRPFCQVEKISA